jgi:hypothetical protein
MAVLDVSLLKGAWLTLASSLLAGCSQPVPDVSKLDGCYYGPGPQQLFEVHGNKLIAPAVTSTVALTSKSWGSSVITFSPGISLTVDAQKSSIVVQGDQKRGLAYLRGQTRYILLSNGLFAVELKARDCHLR